MDILNLKAFELYKKFKKELDKSGLEVSVVVDMLFDLSGNYKKNHGDK